jgi:Ca2+-binding RTX toxin-like protein
MLINTLESRRLLSVSVAFEPSIGVLSIIGSEKPDQIEVAVGKDPLCTLDGRMLGKQATPANKPGNYVNVYDAGRLVYQTFLPGSSLGEIHLFGNGGGDTLMSCNFEAPVTVRVIGSEGADDINAVHFGATPVTEVYAGEGNDQIQVTASIKATSGFLVWGEAGDDVIIGSGLNDVLRGDIDETLERPPVFGDDVIYAGGGNDCIWGGPGNDVLWGEDGDDELYGGAGNDWLSGGEGSDQLDGGDGEDTGIYDLFDKLIVGVEHLAQVK